MILSQASTLALAGVAVGGALSLIFAPSLSSQFYGVKGTDPATYATVAATLLLVALFAAYIPARRAMGTDPAQTLK
jgi:ABC-type antimicrobial peptide transport system permease subunit